MWSEMNYGEEPGDGLLQYDEFDSYQGLGILVFQIATLPVWLPIWAYVRFVHRRPSRRIRKLFQAQRPEDDLIGVEITTKIGKRLMGQILVRSGEQFPFEYHREFNLLTIGNPAPGRAP